MERLRKIPLFRIVDVIVLVCCVVGVFSFFAWPFVYESNEALIGHSGLMALVFLFQQGVLLGIVGLISVLLFVLQLVIVAIRLSPINLRSLARRPTIITPLLGLLGLGRSTTQRDTARLGLVLAALQFVCMLVLLLDSSVIVGSGHSVALVFASIPLLILNVLRLPRIHQFLDGYDVWAIGQPYLEVVDGTLAGARPILEQGQPFYIGRAERKDTDTQNGESVHLNLVLYDEHVIRSLHACVFFQHGHGYLRAYDDLFLNLRKVPKGNYQLRPGDSFKLGRTVIRYDVEREQR